MVKLAVITTTRAEYGLLCPLIKRMRKEPDMDIQLLVSGTHLLEKYGHTIDYIRSDNIPVAHEIPIFDENFVSDERHAGEAIAAAVRQCTELFVKERYDGVIVLGDRYELLGFCSAAVICRIPIIHIHGGEITEGAIDDKVRHAVTKLASVHFPSIQEYANRIIQMGENPDYVFAVGALGLDNVKDLELLSRDKLLAELQIKTEYPLAAVTYHPVTGKSPQSALKEMDTVLKALLNSNVFSVITMPNSDVGGDNIYKKIIEFVKQYPDRMTLKKSLGQLRYLSLLKNADVMVGNSSSGILESASFQLPTVDIGDRQKGRMSPINVVHCPCNQESIEQAIEYCLRKETRDKLQTYVNPYGDGNTADRITNILKKIDFTNDLLVCKKFFDLG